MKKEAKIIRATSYLHEDVMSLAKNFVRVCGGSYKQSQCSNPDSAEYMNKKAKMLNHELRITKKISSPLKN